MSSSQPFNSRFKEEDGISEKKEEEDDEAMELGDSRRTKTTRSKVHPENEYLQSLEKSIPTKERVSRKARNRSEFIRDEMQKGMVKMHRELKVKKVLEKDSRLSLDI